MKRLKPLLLIIVTSTLLQITVLTIFDKYYLVDNYKFKISYLNKKNKETNIQLNNTLQIKNNNYIIISYNEQLIKIYDKKNNIENYIPAEEGNKFENIKSSNDGTKLLIVEKEIKKGNLKNYSYNIENHIKMEKKPQE